MSPVNTVGVFASLLLALSSADAANQWDHSQQLDQHGRFTLKWRANSTHITFETHAHTHGWVGFGISTRASMSPGDACIGYFSNGQKHFADYHTRGHSVIRDARQDWHLETLSESAGSTVMKFNRKLNTHDANDVPIQPGKASHVIYAASYSALHTSANFGHHNLMRGVKVITFIPAITTRHRGLTMASQ